MLRVEGLGLKGLPRDPTRPVRHICSAEIVRERERESERARARERESEREREGERERE